MYVHYIPSPTHIICMFHEDTNKHFLTAKTLDSNYIQYPKTHLEPSHIGSNVLPESNFDPKINTINFIF